MKNLWRNGKDVKSLKKIQIQSLIYSSHLKLVTLREILGLYIIMKWENPRFHLLLKLKMVDSRRNPNLITEISTLKSSSSLMCTDGIFCPLVDSCRSVRLHPYRVTGNLLYCQCSVYRSCCNRGGSNKKRVGRYFSRNKKGTFCYYVIILLKTWTI